MTKSVVKKKSLDIKKPLPAQTGVVYRHSVEMNQMNKTNLSNQTTERNQPEFLVGDVVVLTKECRTFKSNDLFEVKNKTLTSLWTIKSEKHLILVSSKEIRTATVAELNAKRRLTSAEQALAEVS
ncbi:hypothetical protein M1R67_05535 [Acinetobacter baumannii]|nr:hypothetical protein [Acinetobacter baumannii]EKB43013.1 hypothetical protein W9M_03504 [Acinetobacter baumannii Ab44444]MDC4394546.1 hypothetical protein [Acinetobacter baumannii]MDP4052079.1 hypothetical protein [Acinetobacter baumannii]PQH84168.1 hypothetical protein C5U20_19140 [Acinetobacter baumannii]PQI19540.1 hypothetical protein C5T97_12875 [Acinetobacter baumannii]